MSTMSETLRWSESPGEKLEQVSWDGALN